MGVRVWVWDKRRTIVASMQTRTLPILIQTDTLILTLTPISELPIVTEFRQRVDREGSDVPCLSLLRKGLLAERDTETHAQITR